MIDFSGRFWLKSLLVYLAMVVATAAVHVLTYAPWPLVRADFLLATESLGEWPWIAFASLTAGVSCLVAGVLFDSAKSERERYLGATMITAFMVAFFTLLLATPPDRAANSEWWFFALFGIQISGAYLMAFLIWSEHLAVRGDD